MIAAIFIFAFWQFASGTMLLWAAAATAPILIHLFTRRRYRKVTWAAMEYLLAAVQKNRRRLQVEHWLLLLVRTLLLLIFALALADPVLSAVNSIFFASPTQPTHRIYVLDGSYSMDYRREGQSRFAAAKDAIRQQVAQANQGDGFSLFLLANPLRAIIREPAFDPNDVLEELDNLELTHASADVQEVFGELHPLIESVRKQHARLTATEIIFIGDLERRTWQSLASPVGHKRLAQLSDLSQLKLIDVGQDHMANTAVIQLAVNDAPVTVDREFTVQAEIAQYGESSAEKRLATLVVDNEAVAQQSLEIKRNGGAQVAFRHRFASPGDHTLEIRLANDALPVDDARFLSLPVRESLRALCVYGRPGETQYLAAALAPEKSRAARVRVEEVNEAAFVEKNLSEYDAVFLANVPSLSSANSHLLAEYVQAGGGLVIFPGDQSLVEFMASADKTSLSLLPAKLEKAVAIGDYRFDPLEYRHELIEPFRGFERAGLLTTPVWKYMRLVPEPRDDVHIALAFLNKDPAIIEGRFGRGRVVMFAMPASPASVDAATNPPSPWTAFSTWPSFPPLVQETLSFVSRSRDQSHNALVNDEINASLASALPETTVNLIIPSADNAQRNPPRRIPLESKGDAWRWSFADTQHAGLYEVRYGKPLERTDQFAVNLEPTESALERIDLADLPATLLRDNQSATAFAPGGKIAAASNSWFRSALLGVLLLLAVESLLVFRFSGGGS